MSSHPYDRLPLTRGRQLISTPCPGTKGADLAASIRQLHDAAPGHVFEQTWEEHKAEVLALVEQGECVAIHCRSGSGRTGFMAAVILRELGLNGPEATALITDLRPKSLKLAAHSDYLTSHYDTKSEQELLP